MVFLSCWGEHFSQPLKPANNGLRIGAGFGDDAGFFFIGVGPPNFLANFNAIQRWLGDVDMTLGKGANLWLRVSDCPLSPLSATAYWLMPRLPGPCQFNAGFATLLFSQPKIRPLITTTERKILLELVMRASIINQCDRITGNSILEVTDKVLREGKKLSFHEMQKVFRDFIQYQKLRPDPDTKNKMKNLNSVEEQGSQKVMHKIMGLVREHRESL